MFPSIFRYIPCSRKVSSHLIKAVAFCENSEIGGVFVTIRFVRVAERILINRSWTEPRCLGCSLEIMGKEY